MKDKGLISKEWSDQCESMHKVALENLVDTVYPIFCGDMGFSKRWVFFSIYTEQHITGASLGKPEKPLTQCHENETVSAGAGKSHCCLHHMLAMWWIFQESPDLLLPNSDIVVHDIDDLETEIYMNMKSETEMSSYAEND